MPRPLAIVVLPLTLASLIASNGETRGEDPPLPDGRTAGRLAIPSFRAPPGMQVELFAAEPQLASPVAICVDEQGRIFVAEEFRFNRGTEENRTRPFLLEDDLQIATLADRLQMFRKFSDRFDGGMEWFTRHADQIRLLEDTNGDGAADVSKVFAGGFDDPLDGLGAGVIARDGDVFYTCIPHLWRLRDADHDGIADERTALLRGFGVNAGFLGHDLHGLAWGPDGKLYFSVGDRGFHVTTREGQTISGPRNGAIFRCLPDGTEFEVMHRGLRNPQEIAFDQFGNLFAADNNCDKGDHSRLVFVQEGADSGWNMSYQSIPEPYLTGPWHAERLWHLAHEGQPAWVVPPVARLGAGPSGFAYYPGTGLPDRYRDHFFLCNFTGNGGIEAFALQSRGAGFEMIDEHDFFKPILASDLEFGYDGKIYVSDFVGLDWSGPSKGGRIYSLFDPKIAAGDVVRGVTSRFREGFSKLGDDALAELFEHPDLRMRQRAQFELASRAATTESATAPKGERKAIDLLLDSTQPGQPPLRRMHGIWGIGMVARSDRKHLDSLLPLLDGDDDEVKAQVLRVVGDHRHRAAGHRVVPLLTAPSARVRLFAAQALGRMREPRAVAPLFAAVKANADADPYLRHACVFALESIGDREAVQSHARDSDRSVRLAALLVQRGWRDPRVGQFLDDPDPLLATEAARAINDLPLEPLTEKLAALHERFAAGVFPECDPLFRRIIHANFRLGGGREAAVVARLALRSDLSLAVRREALLALIDWQQPSPRDRVTGFWRPMGERRIDAIDSALEPLVPELLSGVAPELQSLAVDAVAKLGLSADLARVEDWATDTKNAWATRSAALRLLATKNPPRFAEILRGAIHDGDPRVRSTARDLLAARDPDAGVRELGRVVDDESAEVLERQRALESLARSESQSGDAVIARWINRLLADDAPPALRLDIFEAAALRGTDSLKRATAEVQSRQTAAAARGDALAKFRFALEGGDAERGRALFVGHAVGQCIRCHKIGGAGGTAGPDLSNVAGRNRPLGREYLLESMVAPSTRIVPGFGSTAIVLTTGKIVSGTIRKETPEQVTLETAAGEILEIPAGDIDERTPPQSPMPTVERALSVRELRDLVAYLATLDVNER